MTTIPRRQRFYPGFNVPCLMALAMAMASCASPGLKEEIYRPTASYSLPPASSGVLAGLANTLSQQIDEGQSGFRLLDDSYNSLLWRLALIDSAVNSVDIVTYLWYPDNSGKLLLERAVLAAQRGVHVRLVIDDLLTIGQDQLIADIENEANIELRLFNPWEKRELMSRAGEMIAEMERLNTRLHDKLLIADGHAAIVGGRNIGDHYFGLSDTYNFHDLDVMGVGPVALQANEMFDHFWNSDMVVSAQNLTTESDPESAREAWENLREQTRAAPELAAFPREVQDWTAELQVMKDELRPGESQVVYDRIQGSDVEQAMFAGLFSFLDQANEELLITNAYLIPGTAGIEFLQRLSDRGVDIRILTNSLSSHDVPAVNSHYEGWRDDLINAGVDLYELRADAAIAEIVNVPPVEGQFVGLHTKAAVIDSRLVFVGSMNLDPRSAAINTEMGIIIDSPELAEDLRAIMFRDMGAENAWHVTLDEEGKPIWTNSDEILTSQPSRGFLQDVMNVIFKIAPKELY